MSTHGNIDDKLSYMAQEEDPSPPTTTNTTSFDSGIDTRIHSVRHIRHRTIGQQSNVAMTSASVPSLVSPRPDGSGSQDGVSSGGASDGQVGRKSTASLYVPPLEVMKAFRSGIEPRVRQIVSMTESLQLKQSQLVSTLDGQIEQLRNDVEELRLEVCQIRPALTQQLETFKSETTNLIADLHKQFASVAKRLNDQRICEPKIIVQQQPNQQPVISNQTIDEGLSKRLEELKMCGADLLVLNAPRLMVSGLEIHEDFQLQEDTIILIVRRGLAMGHTDDEIVRRVHDEICRFCGDNRIWICTLGRRNDCTWSLGNYCEDMGFSIADKQFDLTSFLIPANSKEFVKTEIIHFRGKPIRVRYKGFSSPGQIKTIMEIVQTVLDMSEGALENKARHIRDRIEHINGRKTACFLGIDFKQYGVDSTARFVQMQIDSIYIVIFEANN